MKAEVIYEKLPAFIKRKSGAAAVTVANVRQMTGGASREIWALDAALESNDGTSEVLPIVLRSDPIGGVVSDQRAPEFDLLEAAFKEGVLVPEPFFAGDESLGTGFFLMRRVEGETLARRLLRDDEYAEARRAMPAQLGRTLARIHRIPVEKYNLAGLMRPPAGVSPVAVEMDRYEETLRTIAPEPHPAFELAFRWLRRRMPPAGDRQTLVHGDFRVGNVIFGPEGLRAVLDWEISHIGDPMQDLGWICVRSWRFGGDKPVGGIGTREEFFASYEQESGVKVDASRVLFWEIFGNLRWGIICISQAHTGLNGPHNKLELSAIGRRIVETEVELMELMKDAG
jgi:aminoglycoside phosphotransferase (APT) family kinase protein